MVSIKIINDSKKKHKTHNNSTLNLISDKHSLYLQKKTTMIKNDETIQSLSEILPFKFKNNFIF